MKKRFYIIYNYDNKELPYMLCDTIDEVATALGYSVRTVKHGLDKGYVFTNKNGRYTVRSWDYKKLEEIL